MPERGDLLLAEGGAGGDRAMESAIQHGTATFVAGLSASGTASNLAEATGAWRYGKRCAFPTSPRPPHTPRRLRTNFQRGVTLTFHLVQKIGQVTLCPDIRREHRPLAPRACELPFRRRPQRFPRQSRRR